jgi:hypothetical protein
VRLGAGVVLVPAVSLPVDDPEGTARRLGLPAGMKVEHAVGRNSQWYRVVAFGTAEPSPDHPTDDEAPYLIWLSLNGDSAYYAWRTVLYPSGVDGVMELNWDPKRRGVERVNRFSPGTTEADEARAREALRRFKLEQVRGRKKGDGAHWATDADFLADVDKGIAKVMAVSHRGWLRNPDEVAKGMAITGNYVSKRVKKATNLSWSAYVRNLVQFGPTRGPENVV